MNNERPLTSSALLSAPPLARWISAGVTLAVAIVSWRLWPQWQQNPDLSHGFFMPAIFFLLLYDARSTGTQRFLPAGTAAASTLGVLLFGSLLSLAAAGLYAAAVGWTHAVVNFMLSFALVLLLGATWIGLASERVRIVPLNWGAGIAIALWLLSSPIPPGTYLRVTLALQLWVSENVLRALHLLGVAALRHGNVIELAYGRVGIEEACSGVRSLISCVFAGLFFSATLVRRPWARTLLIVLSVPLALIMNFIRSLMLTLLANRGIDITGTWHDATGYGVLGVTAVLLAGLALLLERREPTATTGARPTSERAFTPSAPTRNPQLITLFSGLCMAAMIAAVFVFNTRPATRKDTPDPNLYAVLPAAVAGWEVDTASDLYQFVDLLQTDLLAQRTYLKRDAEGKQIQVTIYAAFWRAGQTSVSSVASHTPDACWPGAGWQALKPPPVPFPKEVGGRPIAPPEYRLFQSRDFPQHVWFWHIFDGSAIPFQDPYSATALLQIAMRYGFRRDGDQLFVRISSNSPWSVIGHEPLFADFFSRTTSLGL